MIAAMKKDLETRFKDFVDNDEISINIAYTDCKDKAMEFVEQVKKEFPNIRIKFVNPLSLSVSCHIGEGALAIACAREYK